MPSIWTARVRQLRSAPHGRGDLLRTEPRPRRRRQGWRGQDDHDRRPWPRWPPEAGHVGPHRRARGQVGASPPPSGDARTSATRRRSCWGDPAAGTGARSGPGGITPDDALIEYLEDHGLGRVSKRLARSGVLDVVSTAIPGIRDVLVLGKVKQLERGGRADLIVVDAPATGHAITFLTSASGPGRTRPGAGRCAPRPRTSSTCSRPGPLPGHPGHPARGAAGVRDDRVGLHPRGQGGRPAGPGHRERLRPRAGRAGPAGGRGGGGGRRRRSTPGHLAALEEARRFRLARHAVSAEQVERLRPRAAPAPPGGARRSTRRPSGRRRPRRWPTRWREAVHGLAGDRGAP